MPLKLAPLSKAISIPSALSVSLRLHFIFQFETGKHHIMLPSVPETAISNPSNFPGSDRPKIC